MTTITRFAACIFALALPVGAEKKPAPEVVGQQPGGQWMTPTNQLLTPAGTQVELPKMRPQAIALSPDGKLLATSGKTAELVIIDPATGKILQQVTLPAEKSPEVKSAVPPVGAAAPPPKPAPGTDRDGQLSFTGIVFSPDGSRIFMSNVNGSVKEFAVAATGNVTPVRTIPLPPARAPKRNNDIPSGLAVSTDGKLLYVCLNLGNKVAEIEIESRKLLRTFDVGVAPYDVVIHHGRAYVSNWGGRRPGPADLTGPAGRGTMVRVDPVRHIASEGSVSIIDLTTGTVVDELLTGRHASAMALSPDGAHVVVCNTGEDTLSVIGTATGKIIEKIWARPTPADLFGAQPTALAFEKGGDRLFVANGTHNAVAVIEFEPGGSKFEGLIPAGWFPGAIAYDQARKQIAVANIKGRGAHKVFKPGETVKRNSKDYFGTLSLVPVPTREELAKLTTVAHVNMRYGIMKDAALPPRPGVAPRPVPERVGEPSVFKHVLYIIKENRTYDQVLGDMKEGNGDPRLVIFGEKFTPNQHKLSREFALLDNTYCSGIQSADGHQWTNSSMATDYVERNHNNWPRSYMNMKSEEAFDALAYSPAGFIWDNAVKHGVSFRNYGEACISDCIWSDTKRKDRPTWKDFYLDWKNKTAFTKIACKPGVESLRGISNLDTVGWDLNVPDVLRAQAFIDDLRQYEATGRLPQLMMMALPNDHTGGTRGKAPSPGAQVADNDLALGLIVEALSHSRFWPETCIIAIEDDPQNGFDHVSGYRTTCYVISPYTKRKATVSTQYNQTSVMRTIELITGLPPMNLLDATATPMHDVFTDRPDFTPYVAVPNLIPLDGSNPDPKQLLDPQLKNDEEKSRALNLNEPDKAPEDLLNRILWRAMRGTAEPYPEWAVHLAEDDDD